MPDITLFYQKNTKKNTVTHRVTSPLLIGLRDGNNGLGSNVMRLKC
ncbi:MAG: hypothetical protein CM15mV116_090 [uncultured marine virus]|nr:MAG: hypothetical protein CM15mV116_090 [uncultured marine virus]